MRSVGLRGRLVSLNCNDRDNLSTRGGMSLTRRRSPLPPPPLLPFHYLGTHAQCYCLCAVIWPGSAGISPSTMSVWLAPIWTMRVHGSYARSSPACTFYTVATCSWHLYMARFFSSLACSIECMLTAAGIVPLPIDFALLTHTRELANYMVWCFCNDTSFILCSSLE
jgi:hypothetical protein